MSFSNPDWIGGEQPSPAEWDALWQPIEDELNPVVNDALASPAGTGTITQVISWIAGRIKAITGKSSWLTAPAITLEAANTALGTKAPLASPALTGTPTAPTASSGTSTTQLATTAFVTTADALKANLTANTFTGKQTMGGGADLVGKKVENAYIGAVNNSGLGSVVDRLRGGSAHRYTLSSTNFTPSPSLDSIFQGVQDQNAVIYCSAATTGTLTVDFNPFIGWTVNGANGYYSTAGLITMAFRIGQIPSTVLIEVYSGDGGTDAWHTLYSTTSNTELVLSAPIGALYGTVKKLRWSFSHPSTFVSIRSIEYAPAFAQASDDTTMPLYDYLGRDIYTPYIRGKSSGGVTMWELTNAGQSTTVNSRVNDKMQVMGEIVMIDADTGDYVGLVYNSSLGGFAINTSYGPTPPLS